MSILTKDEILKAIEAGRIKIEPFNHAAVGPGSVDLKLGNQFRVFKRSEKIYSVTEDLDYHDLTELIEADSIVIQPGETILGVTEEKISLSSSLCGWLEGRSRFARLGLMVHISAPFMQPGVSNHQVLEIANMSRTPFRLHSGTRFCQFIFEETVGEAKYHGKFDDQIAP
ncbi:MAG: dCTP deaminase [Candidatus Berkelbacteria bacterium]|nr:dCTP deaminase [Candidatus Berkelbacteria bacterium]